MFVLILHKVAPSYLGLMATKICFYEIYIYIAIYIDMLRSCSLLSHVPPKSTHWPTKKPLRNDQMVHLSVEPRGGLKFWQQNSQAT